MPDTTLWVSERDVVSSLDLHEAVAALAAGFVEEAEGSAKGMDKTMATFGKHGTLHALGGAFEGARLVGTKTWAHTPGGADPQLLLFDSDDGSLLAVIEAFALGQMRTAAAAALATDRLARAGASRLGIVGTGKQAMAQVAAVTDVRVLTGVRCYSREPGGRERFAQRVGEELGLVCEPASSVAEALEGADVVTLVTRATAPVVTNAMVTEGMHVNAVGAIALDRCEFESEILARCSIVATDSVAQARQLSSELRDFFGTDPEGWSGLRSLAEVVATGTGRRSEEDVTLFKGMGSGTEDLSLGAAVLARVRERGLGSEIRRSGRAKPRLGPARPSNQGGLLR